MWFQPHLLWLTTVKSVLVLSFFTGVSYCPPLLLLLLYIKDVACSTAIIRQHTTLDFTKPQTVIYRWCQSRPIKQNNEHSSCSFFGVFFSSLSLWTKRPSPGMQVWFEDVNDTVWCWIILVKAQKYRAPLPSPVDLWVMLHAQVESQCQRTWDINQCRPSYLLTLVWSFR